MTASIQILDSTLIDQIAAGEVVERPASVVKELLENAIDAQATRISVECEEGGVRSVRVIDNGIGMSRTDAELAVQRHATSKIRRFEDLSSLSTLGFRGEALPSIASVSRFSLTTRPAEDVAGTRVSVIGGGAVEVSEVGCPKGTTVEAADLFFNVPARRKFLKATQTENAHMAEVCQSIALAHPELHLTLIRNGRRVREFLPCGDIVMRARQIFSDMPVTEIRGSRDAIEIHAVLSAPDRSRSGAGSLHLFVNGRPIRDRRLARAVAFAYGSVLPPGRYPVGAVHVLISPAEVDVNVHPQKSEIRFQRGREVLDAVTRTLSKALGTAGFQGPASRAPSYWSERFESAASSIPPSTDPTRSRETAGEPAADPWGLSGTIADGAASYQATQDAQTTSPAHGGTASAPSLLTPGGFFSTLRVLGQARKMLIVCEGASGLYFLDQHAADERVRYHQLRAAHQAKRIATQRMLFPERVELSPSEAALLEESRDELADLGVEVSRIGETTAAVHAVPALVKQAPVDRLLHDVLAEIGHGGTRAFGDAIDTALATMACHGAIRSGDVLTLEECRALLQNLDAVGEFSGHCPHGRPVIFDISFREIEHKLGR